MQTLPTFNPHPAAGSLPAAILIMADRLGAAMSAAALARQTSGEDAARLDRVTVRRSRALDRLVSALANRRDDVASHFGDLTGRAGDLIATQPVPSTRAWCAVCDGPLTRDAVDSMGIPRWRHLTREPGDPHPALATFDTGSAA